MRTIFYKLYETLFTPNPRLFGPPCSFGKVYASRHFFLWVQNICIRLFRNKRTRHWNRVGKRYSDHKRSLWEHAETWDRQMLIPGLISLTQVRTVIQSPCEQEVRSKDIFATCVTAEHKFFLQLPLHSGFHALHISCTFSIESNSIYK